MHAQEQALLRMLRRNEVRGTAKEIRYLRIQCHVPAYPKVPNSTVIPGPIVWKTEPQVGPNIRFIIGVLFIDHQHGASPGQSFQVIRIRWHDAFITATPSPRSSAPNGEDLIEGAS